MRVAEAALQRQLLVQQSSKVGGDRPGMGERGEVGQWTTEAGQVQGGLRVPTARATTR